MSNPYNIMFITNWIYFLLELFFRYMSNKVFSPVGLAIVQFDSMLIT